MQCNSDLAPGSILQRLYIRERIREISPIGSFIDFGAGSGALSEILLSCGWHGLAFDLNADACQENKHRNAHYIAESKYRVNCQDYLLSLDNLKIDLFIASMVFEHLSDDMISRILSKVIKQLSKNGTIILVVPACKKYWGIEDEIAGHIMRYEREDFFCLAEKYSLNIQHIAGLTFPTSNLLLGISNFLVSRYESKLLDLDPLDRTIASGCRSVPFKTKFPGLLKAFLNPLAMYPLHLLQKVFRNSRLATVLYCELKLK